jgi:chemotaxis protein methyltransferase WspC
VRWNLTAVDPAYLTATPTVPSVTESWIEAAQRLADQGKLTEAMEVCERNFHEDTSSAHAFHLMGLLHDAAGRLGQASEHYRKALYLNPLHQEALVHLGAALMRDGDTAGAQRLFDRAKRSPGASGQ